MSRVNYQTSWDELSSSHYQPIHDASWLDTSFTSREVVNSSAFVEELCYDQEVTDQGCYMWDLVTGHCHSSSIHKPV